MTDNILTDPDARPAAVAAANAPATPSVPAPPPVVAPGEVAGEAVSDEAVAGEAVAPVSAICEGASANAVAQIDDDSEIQPVEGFFLTSQRWH